MLVIANHQVSLIIGLAVLRSLRWAVLPKHLIHQLQPTYTIFPKLKKRCHFITPQMARLLLLI